MAPAGLLSRDTSCDAKACPDFAYKPTTFRHGGSHCLIVAKLMANRAQHEDADVNLILGQAFEATVVSGNSMRYESVNNQGTR